MRALVITAALAALAVPAQGQEAGIDPAERLAQLERQLAAAGQEIQRLRQLEANGNAATAALAQCRTKNEALVKIGRDLITAYGNRYRRGRDNMFQFARTRFETELQSMEEAIHGNRHEVPEQPNVPVVPEQNATSNNG
jgi:hypothetical protein